MKNHLCMSYKSMRRILGILGVTFPFLLIIGTQLGVLTPVLDSISTYYFSSALGIFIGVLSSYALFLISYKGYNFWDDLICNISGVSVLFVIFFPALEASRATFPHLVNFLSPAATLVIHYISAGIFLLSLGAMSLFFFTKSDKKKSEWGKAKKRRNIVYIVCGAFIFFDTLLMGIYQIIPAFRSWGDTWSCFFWLESFAIIAFGISWLVKGETIFKDN